MEYNKELNETFLDYRDEVRIYGGLGSYDYITRKFDVLYFSELEYYDDELDEVFEVDHYYKCDKRINTFYDRLYIINYPTPNKC